MEQRVSADTMLYERLIFDGKECLVTGACIDHNTVDTKLFCYDIISKGTATELDNLYVVEGLVEDSVSGVLIAKEAIDFYGKKIRCMKDAELLENEPLVTIDEVMQEEMQQMNLM